MPSMYKDNDKKAKDNQAKHELKNEQRKMNEEKGKYQYSKKTDHI